MSNNNRKRRGTMQKKGISELVKTKMMNEETANYLIDKAKHASGIIICGGACTGKTTLMNELLEYIPHYKKGLVFQEYEELFAEKCSNLTFKHADTLKGFNCNYMPDAYIKDYIIFSEIKVSEARYFLNACVTGHQTWCTVPCKNSTDVIFALEDIMKCVSYNSQQRIMKIIKNPVVVIFMKNFKVCEISEITGFNNISENFLHNSVHVNCLQSKGYGFSQKMEKEGIMESKVFESSEKNVWKYVFTKTNMVAEAVLYKYEDFYKRTVICCSTMSGCPVGCKFCGTGNKFIRNLTSEEIVEQIKMVLKDKNIEDVNDKSERFQIMLMSMGEPLLNWDSVDEAVRILHKDYPNAELLLSTIAPDESEAIDKMIQLSKEIDKVGLQFSIHKSNDEKRNTLIPYSDKLTLEKIRDLGIIWWQKTGRHPYLNYCIDGTNNTEEDIRNLQQLFSPVIFNFTFSVVCSPNENMKDAGFRNLNEVRKFEYAFLEKGYNTRIFDPAGQDDIGGGCGQLWYVQQWLKNQ